VYKKLFKLEFNYFDISTNAHLGTSPCYSLCFQTLSASAKFSALGDLIYTTLERLLETPLGSFRLLFIFRASSSFFAGNDS